MRLIGFNFTKISADKTGNDMEKLKVNTKIDVVDIKNANADILNIKESVVGINFKYEIEYDPGFAKIDFEGKLLITLEPEKAKELVENWKEKIFPEDVKVGVFNIILRKSNLKALQLEEELGIPLHISMPSLKKQEGKQEEKQDEKQE